MSSLDPIQPQHVLGEQQPYRERKRTPLERFLDKFKPRTNVMRTTFLVAIIALFSLWMSLWFFWRTLYLPEIKQHAQYLSLEIQLIQQKDVHIVTRQQTTDLPQWLRHYLGTQLVEEAQQFPKVKDKFLAEIFTDRLAQYLAEDLNTPVDQVTVYFQFKPEPQLWIQTPQLGKNWLREPLTTYANYSPELILAWLLGTPLLTVIISLILTRQLNRPLKRLQHAATTYSKTGKAPYLDVNHGPLELRQVNQSFNQMISHLQQTEQDRRIMLAGISHDLRTPLTRIRLTAEMLPDEYLKEGLIYDVDDMDAILNQFISFMRDGSDEEPHDTNVNQLIQEIVVQFKPLDIQFTPQELPIIRARALSLKRVIGNLVNNAKRYGAEPIHIAAFVEQQQMVISVSDHGEGIPESQVQALMQPFVRGDSARTIQGSGLGLAIVKRIIDIHQGHISIKNHQQGGLEVKIYLPLESAVQNDEQASTLNRIKQKLNDL